MKAFIEENKILANWGISNESVKQIYGSAWDIGGRYVLKTGTNFASLNSNLSLMKVLAAQDIPVASIIKTLDGAEYITRDNSYYFLSKKIKGEHINNIYGEDYKVLSLLIGQVIGKLHIGFEKCQDILPCRDNNFYDEITGWVLSTIREKEVNLIPKDIINECILQLEAIYYKLPRQLIHRDIHLNNMLFYNKVLTGYIDFDLSQIDVRIFDLCYMALGLLIDNINDDNKTAKWFEIVKNIVEGYNEKIPLTMEEKKAMPVIMMAIEMLFVAYFTNENNKVCADGAAEMLIWLWKNKEKIEGRAISNDI
ncbi:phosphotransferase [Clostridium sp. C2-6-12]|uniref:phosphotransferase n=1 Tax=Clostridium sp. C2-6-12 TaxID=2698832 RepID=UPI00136C0A8B|nr:phosphotransferase [Clostridium sp. C2-6-12]